MIHITSREDVAALGGRVSKLMYTYGVSVTRACCFLNTYPDDTRYCSGNGLYGDKRDTSDCPFKDQCRALHEEIRRHYV